jgi:AmiR/NasT family two-component response regulator
MRNAAQYRECRRTLDNLHIALASQATIEQAKGI